MPQSPESRVGAITRDLVDAFQKIVAKHGITHEEYRAGVAFVNEAAEAGEGFLLPDAFLEAIVVANASEQQQGTPSQVLGPYYKAESRWIDDGRLAPDDEPGDELVVRGSVRDQRGQPIAGVVLDVWQADAQGRYSGFAPGVPEDHLRGRLRTDDDGRYEFRTVVPAPYRIPDQGPTGRLLAEIGRHSWRPAHLHVIASRDGYRTLTTQIYFEGDEYLGSDSVRAARADLAFPLETEGDGKALRFDCVLEAA